MTITKILLGLLTKLGMKVYNHQLLNKTNLKDLTSMSFLVNEVMLLGKQPFFKESLFSPRTFSKLHRCAFTFLAEIISLEKQNQIHIEYCKC